MIFENLKKLKPFHVIGILIFLGLLYGAINLYNKIQFYKSFANQTRITSVVAKKAELGQINKIYPATSVIESNKSYDVISKTDGILNDIFFNESSFVKKGDRLFSVLSTMSIGEIILSAPFDGYVGITDYKIGDKLKNGDLLLTLDDMTLMKAYLYLPEKILPQIKGPIKFNAYSKLFPNELYTGEITNLDQRVDTDTRTLKSYALIKNKTGLLRPGILINIDIILDEINDAILIPEKAILTSRDYSYVFVIDKDLAKLRKVITGISNDGKTQILEGISSDDLVVTLGHEKLKDGSRIKLIEK
tara:strand:+ start:9561 stop:10469 length:909 start_codon:yes stop_codon:yes gene_type:complete